MSLFILVLEVLSLEGTDRLERCRFRIRTQQRLDIDAFILTGGQSFGGGSSLMQAEIVVSNLACACRQLRCVGMCPNCCELLFLLYFGRVFYRSNTQARREHYVCSH